MGVGWHRRVWQLAGPLIIANLSIPLLGAMDTAVVGHLPDPMYIGGVALGSLIFSYIYWGFSFLRMATTGLTAQALGAGRLDEVRAGLARPVILAGLIAALLLALHPFAVRVALAILDGSVGVESQASVYFRIRIWAAPAVLANWVIIGWLFGVRRTGTTLVLQVLQNGVNIGLDILFVVGFEWGVPGVAVATVIAQYVGLGVGAVLVVRILRQMGGSWRRELILERKGLMAAVDANGNIFLRSLVLLTTFAYFTHRGAQMGDVVLAANAILMQFVYFQAYGLDAFAHAAEILVGSAAGARDSASFRKAVRVTTQWAAGVAVLATLFFALLGAPIVRVMTEIEAVRQASYTALVWAVIAPLVSVWSYQLDGIFIGTTRVKEMRNGAIISAAVYFVTVPFLVRTWGNHGLWIALLVLNAMRGITLGAWYPRVLREIDTPGDRVA